MSIRSAFVLAVPAVLLAGVAVAAGAHASTDARQPVSLTGAVAPIAAGASSTAATGAQGDKAWPKLCARAGKGLTRAGAADARLHTGADTKGSLARLQARLDAATKAGDADRVRVLTDLMAIRQSHAATVTVKVEKLTDVQQVCKSHAG